MSIAAQGSEESDRADVREPMCKDVGSGTNRREKYSLLQIK